jgi:hypothetical protein
MLSAPAVSLLCQADGAEGAVLMLCLGKAVCKRSERMIDRFAGKIRPVPDKFFFGPGLRIYKRGYIPGFFIRQLRSMV